MITNLDFLEFITDEEILRKLYDNIHQNVQSVGKDYWKNHNCELFKSKKEEYYDTVFEALESRLDELADNVPYGSQDSGTEVGRYKTKTNTKEKDNG